MPREPPSGLATAKNSGWCDRMNFMFTLPDLPYDYKALEPYIDAETMRIHHDKHHDAYVKNLNDALKDYPDLLGKDIEEIVKDLESVPEEVRLKVKNHGGGHANHSLFWTLMAPNPKEPSASLVKALESAFTSLDSFKEKFTAAAMGRFGSGWAWLTSDNGKLEIVDTPTRIRP